VAAGQEVRAFEGHKGSVYTCAFSLDGRRVLSGSSDNTLKLWDAAAGQEVRAFVGHQGSVYACVFTPEGRYVLSGSSDNTLKLWDAAAGTLLRSWNLPSTPHWIAFDPTRPTVVALALSMGVIALLDIGRPASFAAVPSDKRRRGRRAT
jgi:WD40 repeat protein